LVEQVIVNAIVFDSQRGPFRGRELIWTVFVMLAVLVEGCGRGGLNLAEVDGVVTLDGEALPHATVQFHPQVRGTEGARPSLAATNSNGEYKLQYSITRSGVLPGRHKVTISTFSTPDEDANGNLIPGTPETVPDAYNTRSTLTADVPPEGGTFDFELTSDAGPVIQPGTPRPRTGE
jgi:hypothetical protein